MNNIGSSLDSFLEEEGILQECTVAAVRRNMTCSTCKHWATSPIPQLVGGQPSKERLCLRSLNMDSGFYGQDGKAVIVGGDFGCIFHDKKLDANQI